MPHPDERRAERKPRHRRSNPLLHTPRILADFAGTRRIMGLTGIAVVVAIDILIIAGIAVFVGIAVALARLAVDI